MLSLLSLKSLLLLEVELGAFGLFVTRANNDTFFLLLSSLFRTLLLLSRASWTRRVDRCRPFFPPIRAFNFYRA